MFRPFCGFAPIAWLKDNPQLLCSQRRIRKGERRNDGVSDPADRADEPEDLDQGFVVVFEVAGMMMKMSGIPA
jgi:hypothetical protein